MNEEHIIKYKEYWNTLQPFVNTFDVPNIPRVNNITYREFFIPKLIQLGAIPKKDLIDLQLYIGNHRNCTEAVWNKEKNKFIYKRFKFGCTFDDECNHFEDDDGYALFVPIKIKENEELKESN